MNIKKSTLGLIVFIFLFGFLISFAWAEASFEPGEDIWSTFYHKLIILLPGPVCFLVATYLFRKKKWWTKELK